MDAGEAALIGIGIGLLGTAIQEATKNRPPRQPSQSTYRKWQAKPHTQGSTYRPTKQSQLSEEDRALRRQHAQNQLKIRQQIEREKRAEASAKLAAESNTWGKFKQNIGWTRGDTREVQKGVAQGIARKAAKQTLARWVNDTFGNGTAETQELSEKAADVLMNLKTGVRGAAERVGSVRDAFKEDIQKWLDEDLMKPLDSFGKEDLGQ